VECLATLVGARVRLGVAVDGFQCPLGVLELHLLLLFGLRVDLLFALLLMGRRAFLARLLLHLLTELLYELLDFPTLLDAVAPRVVHRASCTAIIAAGRLSLRGPRPTPATAATGAVAVGAPASGWLWPLAFFFLLFLFLLPLH
jgi:hypothetical protein